MSQGNGSAGAELRRSPRKAVTRTVIVVYDRQRVTARGTMFDISADGAMVRLPPSHKLPGIVHMIDLAERTIYECAVCRQEAGRCGLRFNRRFALPNLPGELNFLSAIWLDHAQR